MGKRFTHYPIGGNKIVSRVVNNKYDKQYLMQPINQSGTIYPMTMVPADNGPLKGTNGIYFYLSGSNEGIQDDFYYKFRVKYTMVMYSPNSSVSTLLAPRTP